MSAAFVGLLSFVRKYQLAAVPAQATWTTFLITCPAQKFAKSKKITASGSAVAPAPANAYDHTTIHSSWITVAPPATKTCHTNHHFSTEESSFSREDSSFTREESSCLCSKLTVAGVSL